MAWQITKRLEETWCAVRGRWSTPPPACRWPAVAAWSAAAVWAAGMEGAQAESAPFVFEGQVLHIDTPGWVSHEEYRVAEPAYIDVAEGVQAHIAGDIKPVFGSDHGLYKLGGGTLRLSGATSYRGGTQLWQGGLQVDGPLVFGWWGGLEALRGTMLAYSPGTEVSRPLSFRDADIEAMPSVVTYLPVAPLPGLEAEAGWRVDSGQALHSGLLQGNGPFVKLGAGVLDITGDAMAYTGHARVAEGTLAVNEIFSGSVQVQAGARLRGVGLVGGVHVESGGVLAPGNAGAPALGGAGVGTLVVTGDARFDSGSQFQIRAEPTGQADFLEVGGQAALDGNVSVLAQAGVWSPTTSYPILTAAEGLDDTRFAGVSTDLAFLAPSLSYDAHTVTLTLARNDIPVDDVSETPDEKDVGEIIDEEVPPGGELPPAEPPPPAVVPDPPVTETPPSEAAPDPPDDTPVAVTDDTAPAKATPELHDRIVQLDRPTARHALRQLTGSWNASVLSSTWDDSRFVREAVLRQASLGATAHPNASTPLRPWVAAFYSDQRRGETAGVPGDRRRLDGWVIGMATVAHAVWKVGGFAGMQRSRLRRSNGMAQALIETTHFGMYMAAQVDAMRLAAGAVRHLHRVSSHRAIRAGRLNDATAARYRGATSQVFGEVAWPLGALASETGGADGGDGVSGNVVFARLAWVRTRLNGHTEAGGVGALNVQPAFMTGRHATVGLRLETRITARRHGVNEARLFAEAAWQHASNPQAYSSQAFRDSATQTRFTSQGLPVARQAWSLQLGVDARLGKASRIGVGYHGRFASRMRDQGVAGWASIPF